MTPLPERTVFSQRHLLNLRAGDIHFLAFKEYAMDGIGVKDILSDFALGSILWATVGDPSLKLWDERGAEVFQIPFVERRFIRKGPKYMVERHFGDPFLGPDRKVLKLEGITLHGNSKNLEVSRLKPQEVINHPAYNSWLDSTLFVGLGPNHPAISSRDPNHPAHRLSSGNHNLYVKKRGLRQKRQVDQLVNHQAHKYKHSLF